MKYTYGKKSLSQKISGGFKSILKWGLLAASLGTVGFYHYGTVEETVVKVNAVEDNGEKVATAEKDGVKVKVTEKTKHDFVIRTTGERYRNDKSVFHLKSDEDTKDLQSRLEQGKTYKIKSYGSFRGYSLWEPNILKIEEVAAQNPPAAVEQKQDTLATRFSQAAALSGETKTITVVVDVTSQVEMTVPVEAADKITGVKIIQSIPEKAPTPN